MRAVVAAVLVTTSCTFTAIAADDGDPSDATDEGAGDGTAAAQTSTGVGETGAVDGNTEDGPADDTTSAGEAGEDGESSGDPTTADSGGPTVEICNGVDDDGDGFVDEFSSANAECGDCTYLVGPHTEFVYSFCTDATTAVLADFDCQVLGARLASIHDGTTNDFIHDNQSDRSFIGLNDIDAEDTWVWMDGTPFDYENWDTLEPNDAGGGQDCVVMRDLGSDWDDVDCAIAHPFVCRGPL